MFTADDRRGALRERLILAATARVAAGGPASLRARDLASEAGCAVGAIYNLFPSLADLVLAVNARTMERLGGAVRAAAPGGLAAMAHAYRTFAAADHGLWRALFDAPAPGAEAGQAAYAAEMDGLIALIEQALPPGGSAAERRLLARALFGAVHGVVLLALDGARAGVPMAEVDGALALLLRRLAS